MEFFYIRLISDIGPQSGSMVISIYGIGYGDTRNVLESMVIYRVKCMASNHHNMFMPSGEKFVSITFQLGRLE